MEKDMSESTEVVICVKCGHEISDQQFYKFNGLCPECYPPDPGTEYCPYCNLIYIR